MNPNYIKSKEAYFNVETNTIYAPEFRKGSYWHEYRHYKDHQNKTYRKLKYIFSLYIQVLCFIFIFFSFRMFYFLFSLYALFIVQEELRAYYYEYKMNKRFEL